MGPPVSPAILPRARWLAALVLPLAIAATVDSVDSASVVRPPPRFDMAAYARLHRRWVADHGPGCARDMAHLADYVPGHQIADPWGSELHLECARVANPYTSRYQLTVTVMSSGPDRILHDEDDLVGSDTTDAGSIPETEETETLRILDEIRVAGIEYIDSHPACFNAPDDIRAGRYATLRLRDTWDNPIAVDCIAGTVEAISRGPDGVAGTADDLRVADSGNPPLE